MAIPAKVIIYQSNTQEIDLYGLQDKDTGVFWSAATAYATLFDQLGNPYELINQLPLTYQGSLGNYSGTFTSDANIAVGGGYTLAITATQGAATYHIEIPAEVQVRTS